MSDLRLAPASRPPNFLAGPADQLRLTWRAALATVLFGTSLLVISLSGHGEWITRLASIASASVTALAIALLAARWFGPRTGMLAGMIQLTVCYTLQLARLADPGAHFTAAVTVAMCSFAAANVDSPRGRSTARWLPWTFALAMVASFRFAGLLGPALIGSCCGLFLLVNQDFRGVRFFLDPVGLGLVGSCVAFHVQAGATQSHGGPRFA